MIVDILVVLVLLASAFIAFLRGFIREVLTIFGIVGGMVAAYIGGPLLIPHMRQWLGVVEGEEPQKLFDAIPYTIVADGLSYGLVLVVFIIILSILSHFISEFARSIGLGALDRTLGVVFGLARGILLLGLLYLPFYYLIDPETKKSWFEGSKTHVYLEATAGWISGFIPEETKEGLQENVDKFKENSETRDKLEEMDILNKDKENTPALEVEPIDGEKKDGYSNTFRNQMEKLIEKATEQSLQPEQQPEQTPQENPQPKTDE